VSQPGQQLQQLGVQPVEHVGEKLVSILLLVTSESRHDLPDGQEQAFGRYGLAVGAAQVQTEQHLPELLGEESVAHGHLFGATWSDDAAAVRRRPHVGFVERDALEARHLREVLAKVADVVERLQHHVHEASVTEVPQTDDLLLFGTLGAAAFRRRPIVRAAGIQRV